MENLIRLTYELIDLNEWVAFDNDLSCGASVYFIGKVRDKNEGHCVCSIDYSSYEPMAEKQMTQIVKEASQMWKFERCILVHRLGKLQIGDISVLLIVTSEHRKEAFESCQWMIDQLKQRVPIWKKEFYKEGSQWLG